MAIGARATSGLKDRRRFVEATLAGVVAPARPVRTPPPDGPLGADRYATPALVRALPGLGPLFTGFGRYLASRADLLGRRDAAVLATLPDEAAPLPRSTVDAVIAQQLGRPRHQAFFEFDPAPRVCRLWTQRHDAWLAPGVPVWVTIVRPDAEAWLQDAPLLTLLQPWFETPEARFREAADDYVCTLRRRLDQVAQGSAFATLAADASSGAGGFGAPVVYLDHCAPGILTVEANTAPTLADMLADRIGPGRSADGALALARRVAGAWLQQVLAGRVVPYDVRPDDVLVEDDRLVLIDGAFEPHGSVARRGLRTYLLSLAAADPDVAGDWILDGAGNDDVERHEEGLRRRLRQAVPFRDGEWSGDERMAEHAFAHWRMAALSGWRLSSHHMHVYLGLHDVAMMVAGLRPDNDLIAAALRDEQVRGGLAGARQALEPGAIAASLTERLQGLLELPRVLDNVLTRASEGRLRVRLSVPEGAAAARTRNRTVMLVATLVALTGLAVVARDVAPAFGGGVETAAAIVVLVLGGWLLIAAARL